MPFSLVKNAQEIEKRQKNGGKEEKIGKGKRKREGEREQEKREREGR